MADSVSRWLDWTEANRNIYLGTIAPGEDLAAPEVRRVVADLRGRAVALLVTFHADIARDSLRLRYALECWTGLSRTATRRWLRGDATREATHELLASTLEHVLSMSVAHSHARPAGLDEGRHVDVAEVAATRIVFTRRGEGCGPPNG